MSTLSLAARAAGCLLGVCVGDAWGAPYEFSTEPLEVPDGYRTGVFGTAPGHPTDDSTLALLLAEHLADVLATHGGRPPAPDEVTWNGYVERLVAWADSGPPDIGNATSHAAACWRQGRPPPPNEAVQGNGSLMALAPIGIAWAGRPQEAAAVGARFAALTHPSSVAAQVNADAAALLATLIAGDPIGADDRFHPALPGPPTRSIGWCRIAWALAARATADAAAGTAPLEAMRAVIACGGDTDTNAAIAGGFLGAQAGPDAWAGWPVEGLAQARRARQLADRLLPPLPSDR